MQKSTGQTEFKFLALVCLLGTVLLFAPDSVVLSVKSTFLDCAAPGQELTVHLVEQGKTALKQFEPVDAQPENVARLQQEIEAWKEATQRLQSQNLALLQAVKMAGQQRTTFTYQSNSNQALWPSL